MQIFKKIKLHHYAFLAMVLFGCFYRISTSEFWPITTSKTWFTPSQFEFSMLQKPLLTLLLACYHILPLSDISHLLLVKASFAFLGAFGIWALINFIFDINSTSEEFKDRYIGAGMLLFVTLSPTILSHYFSVRSDQLAACLFSFFLFFSYKKLFLPSLFCLVLIPLAGVKEVLFLPAGLFIFYTQFKHLISKRNLFFSLYGLFAILVWLAAYNVSAFNYFIETFNQTHFSLSRISVYTLQVESLSLGLTALSILYIFHKKSKKLFPYAISSIYFSLVVLVIPQPYSFLIASLLPFILLPLAILILHLQNKKIASLVVGAVIIFTSIVRYNNNALNYNSSFQQLEYIKIASKIIEENNLHYLDGIGILPRQKHYPCFASPYDEIANTSCLNRILEQPLDSIIITSRLMYVGEQVFKVAETNYQQIIPNLWINKNKINESIVNSNKRNADLTPAFILF